MKVKELIESLQKLDQEKRICIRNQYGEPCDIESIIYENDLFKFSPAELPATDQYLIE